MRRPSVLVVDGDAFSRAVVSRRMARLADVVEAEDGLGALERLQAQVFDLAIVDLELPNFNGLDLIKCVRGHPTLKHIPIIVLTGNESRSALEGALTAGATSFLLKPSTGAPSASTSATSCSWPTAPATWRCTIP